MWRLQAVLNGRQEWADADDLRPECERDEEEPGQYGSRAHSRIFSLVSSAAQNLHPPDGLAILELSVADRDWLTAHQNDRHTSTSPT